jgi:hypothetical protein
MDLELVQPGQEPEAMPEANAPLTKPAVPEPPPASPPVPTMKDAIRIGRYLLYPVVGGVGVGLLAQFIHPAPARTPAPTPVTARVQAPPIEAKKPELRAEPERVERKPEAVAPIPLEPAKPDAPLILKAPVLENPPHLAEPPRAPATAPKLDPLDAHKPSSPRKAAAPHPDATPPATPEPRRKAALKPATQAPPPAPETQVVEPEEKAKHMAEARRLYLSAFGEMKKNPAGAKQKFQKVMDLAGPKEPIWTAALKWIQEIDGAPQRR